MQLRNHIVYYLLLNPKLVTEAAIADYKRDVPEVSQETLEYVTKMASVEGNRSFYITNTVLDKLHLLKVNSNDWSIFDNKQDAKYTFIFKDDSFLRFIIEDRDILFYYVKRFAKGQIKSSYFYHSFHDNKSTGDFYPNKDFVFKLLCFFFYAENQEIVVNGGKSYGTKKQPDALNNDSNMPITIVNSNWNITSVRLQGFDVSGHFRLQPCGKGNS